MKTIYKYTLPIVDSVSLELHVWSEPLSVQVQNGAVCVWVLVDTDLPKRLVEDAFRIFGTGHPIPDDVVKTCRFVDTIQMNDGQLVFHVFARADV